MDKLLAEILSYRRNYETASEKEFIANYIATIPNIQSDIELNFFVKIGESETMFSCHTDTVHWSDGKQKVCYISDLDMACKITAKEDAEYDGECLGADDGAGIWIMLNMIEAGIPGLYVFHRGEECGGIGSSYIAEENPDLVKGIKRCIAFDRRGAHDIITHQAGGRCCSDEFAWALATEFATAHNELDLYPCDRGLFTDSANYTHLIPECTNISVGYDSEHRVAEILDIDHLSKLLDACLKVDWESLPTVREPVEDDLSWVNSYNTRKPRGSTGSMSYPTRNQQLDTWVGYDEMGYNDILEVCRNSPEIVAEYIFEMGVTYNDIQRIYDDLYGFDHEFRYRGI